MLASSTDSASTNTSQVESSDDASGCPPPVRRRKSRRVPLSGDGGMSITISQRRQWLSTARGRPEVTVTHMLQHVEAWYHRDIDPDPPELDLQPVAAAWESEQPRLRQWLAAVLQHRNYVNSRPLSPEDEAAASSTARKGKGQRRSKREDRGSDSEGGKGTAKQVDSDWAEEFEKGQASGFYALDPLLVNPSPRWRVTMPMPDRLYLELIKALLSLDVNAHIASLTRTDPPLAKVLRRQLLEHGRYHVFWAHANLHDPVSSTRFSRLIPVLFRVHQACRTDSVLLHDCKRCIPMSQVPLLLDSIHSGGAHLKDSYATLMCDYCGIPRKAVRLFADKCHACNRVDTQPRNERPPRAIHVAEIRQRYTLDLVDMEQWMRGSTGVGKGKRYVAQMIDFSSKFRWTYAIKHKTGTAVLEVLRQVFTTFGHTALLHTDNGTEFANWQVEEECRRWGTRVIHGRPYHPQSQGVVERVNGVLKRGMRKWRASHPTDTDWTFIMSQVTLTLNTKESSITRRVPHEHFVSHNHLKRRAESIPPAEPVVITVQQVSTINTLSWVDPCETLPYDYKEPEEDEEEAKGTEEHIARDLGDTEGRLVMEDDPPDTFLFACSQKPPSLFASTPLAIDRSTTAGACVPGTTTAPIPSVTAPPASVTLSRLRSRTAMPQSMPVEPDLVNFDMLRAGESGSFIGTWWDKSLGPEIRQRMRRVGSIANGDCGPATAFFARYQRLQHRPGHLWPYSHADR